MRYYLILLLMMYPLNSVALPEFCDRSLTNLWCTAEAINDYPLNFPTLSGYDAGSPMVIRGNTTVTLTSAISLEPADWPTLFAPALIIREGSHLQVNVAGGVGAGTVAVRGHIFLCDDSSLTITSSSFRADQAFEYQYWLWADGNSVVTMEDSELEHLAPATTASSPNEHGNWLWWFRGTSTLLTSNIYGKRLTRDVRQVAAMDDARVVRVGETGMSETYIAGAAVVELRDSEYLDVFFSVCEGDTLVLDGLPNLCAISNDGGPFALCNTPAHVAIDYSLAPPDATYNYTIVNSKIFSWAVESLPTSSTVLRNTGQYANFALGLQIATEEPISGVVAPGPDPTLPAVLVDDHGFESIGSTVLFIHMWNMPSGSRISLDAGSEIGDFLTVSKDVQLIARETDFTAGQMMVQSGNRYELHACNVAIRLRVDPGCILVATGQTSITSATSLYNNASLVMYDSAPPANMQYVGTTGTLCLASFTSPVYTGIPGGITELQPGDMLALSIVAACFRDTTGDVLPGSPDLILRLHDDATNTSTDVATATGPYTTSTHVFDLDTSLLTGEYYTVALLTSEDDERRWQDSTWPDTTGARRKIRVVRTAAPTASPTPTPSAAPTLAPTPMPTAPTVAPTPSPTSAPTVATTTSTSSSAATTSSGDDPQAAATSTNNLFEGDSRLMLTAGIAAVAALLLLSVCCIAARRRRRRRRTSSSSSIRLSDPTPVPTGSSSRSRQGSVSKSPSF
jgi:hypothetical protein